MRALVFVLLFGCAALAQESVTASRPARTVRVPVIGEVITYHLTDAGVTCMSRATAPIALEPEPLTAAQCTASRARTRNQVADAIDGGALD